MFGFLLGVAATIGAAAIMKRRYRGCRGGSWYGYGRRHGRGGRWWHEGGGAHHGGPYRGFAGSGWGRAGAMAGFLSSRIEATPEQERLIRNEIETFFESTGGLRREMRLSRDDVAQALRNDSFDEEVMGGSFARQDEQLQETRKALVGALARIHDALDERQRRRLAEILESGSGRPRWM